MKNKVFWIVLVIAFLLAGYLLAYMTTEGKKCLENPYVYGAKAMGDVECSCIQNKGLCSPLFDFNDTSFTAIPVKCGGDGVFDSNETYIKNITLSILL